MPANGEKYVTQRDLADKLDAIHDQIGGEGGLRERMARMEATLSLWLKVGPILIAAAITFGPDVARALT